MRENDNKDLSQLDISSTDADWSVVRSFALTFDGYDVSRSFAKYVELANTRGHDSLTDPRTCLYFEQPLWCHREKNPDKNAKAYIRSVIEQIRSRVAAGDVA
jgi:hypothetical protein